VACVQSIYDNEDCSGSWLQANEVDIEETLNKFDKNWK